MRLAVGILIGLMCCWSAGAQVNYNSSKIFNKQQLEEDLAYLQDYLIKGHPGLFWYTSEVDFENEMVQFSQSLRPEMTELEFLAQVGKLNGVIKCSHSDIRPSNNYNLWWRDSVNLIPLNIFKLGSEYFVNQNLSNNPELEFGTQIISINERPIEEIVNEMLPYIPADGDNVSRKYDALKKGCYRYYAYYINSASQEFLVTYKSALGRISKYWVQGVSKSEFDKRRNELFSTNSDPISFEVIDSISTAVLKISSFRNDLFEKHNLVFENYVDKFFEHIKRAKIKNLIIDLRGNSGGYSEYAAVLYSYLTDTSFVYCKRQTLTADSLINGITYDIPETFNGFPNGIVWQNGKYQWLKHSVLGSRLPNQNNFKGQLYVLIDGGCSSTTSELSSLVRTNKKGIFIGQEVGGAYWGNTGGVLGWFELPNSKIRVRIGMVKYTMVEHDSANRKGVIPDYMIEPNIQDIRDRRDVELEFTIRKIGEEQNASK